MILCIEGAPGVGKSTTAAALAARGACIVPEVNQLFAKPKPAPAEWYYERQLARSEMAQLKSELGQLAVLDGDLLQPLWFGWIYQNDGWPPADVEFYRRAVAQQRLRLPDRYVFAHIAEPERRERMLARERGTGRGEERAQAKTARYARMVGPQRRYFEALAERFAGWVQVVETTSLATSVADIEAAPRPRTPPDGLTVLGFIAEWLRAHAPGD
jgi:hypothetical protein